MIHLIGGRVRHLLIVFGGLSGLEESIEEDNNLKVYIEFKNTIQ
jgi:Putative RNA methyltransferase